MTKLFTVFGVSGKKVTKILPFDVAIVALEITRVVPVGETVWEGFVCWAVVATGIVGELWESVGRIAKLSVFGLDAE